MIARQAGLAIRMTAVTAITLNLSVNWLPDDAQHTIGSRMSLAVILVATGLWFVWDNYGWRTYLRIVPSRAAELIHGTWQGCLESSWVNPASGMEASPKTVFLVVRQSFTRVNIRLLSDEAVSYLVTGQLNRDGERLRIVYVYEARPVHGQKKTNPSHAGAASLEIVPDIDTTITGHYWTDRTSMGELQFTKRVSKCASGYREATRFFTGSA